MSKEGGEGGEGGYPVSLNVYDLSGGWLKMLSEPVIGKAFEAMWHSGVVVYGMEYFWAGDLMSMPAGTTQYGKPLRNIPLGTTHLDKAVVDEYVDSLRPQYNANTYSLLTKNCNNFSNELSLFLLGHGIPEEIVNLPKDVLSTPVGAAVKPVLESIERQQKAMALSQQQQYQQYQQYQQAAIFYPPAYSAPPPQSQGPPSYQAVQQDPNSFVQPSIFYPPAYSAQKDAPSTQQQEAPKAENPTPLISFNCNPKVFVTKLRSTKKVSPGVIGEIRNAILDPSSCRAGLTRGTHAFFEEALATWPPGECVAPLFLLRGLATHSFFPAHYFRIGEDRTPVVDEARAARLCEGLRRQVTSKDGTCAVLGLTALMNMFATPCGEAFAKSQCVLRGVFVHALDALDSEDAELRKMAAALAYNYASAGPFADEALGATCTFRLSVAILKKYPKKKETTTMKKKDTPLDASVYALTAFKYLLVNNPAFAGTASKNPQLTSHMLSLAKDRATPPRVCSLANELCTILNISPKSKK